MTGVELLHERSLSPYYFFIVVIVIRYETTAAARWALLFIVRTFFNYAFAVALWAGFHNRLTSRSLARAARASDLRSQVPKSNSERCAPLLIRREGRGW